MAGSSDQLGASRWMPSPTAAKAPMRNWPSDPMFQTLMRSDSATAEGSHQDRRSTARWPSRPRFEPNTASRAVADTVMTGLRPVRAAAARPTDQRGDGTRQLTRAGPPVASASRRRSRRRFRHPPPNRRRSVCPPISSPMRSRSASPVGTRRRRGPRTSPRPDRSSTRTSSRSSEIKSTAQPASRRSTIDACTSWVASTSRPRVGMGGDEQAVGDERLAPGDEPLLVAARHLPGGRLHRSGLHTARRRPAAGRTSSDARRGATRVSTARAPSSCASRRCR